jgi:hypothetical protein
VLPGFDGLLRCSKESKPEPELQLHNINVTLGNH